MPDFTVIRVGTDSSGRGIYMTRFRWQVWQALLRRPRVTPFAHKIVIVQGGFMGRNGGGAAASAGYHDGAGTEDVRTWNLTPEEQRILWWEAALLAIIFWPRGPAAHMGGMDAHGHSCSGWDHPISSGIAAQWRDAMPPNRGSGLASGGPDYVKPRPPWVAFPPAELLQEDYMATDDAQRKLEEILDAVKDVDRDLEVFRTGEHKRDKAAAEKAKAVAQRAIAREGMIVDRLIAIANDCKDDATKAQVQELRALVQQGLADDPDVDGPDNPASPS